MNTLARLKFFLWYFGHFKVPLIGHLKPKLLKLTSNEIIILIKLNRRSKNHLNSMYFGALAIGADLAAGFHGIYHANLAKKKVSLAFKSFQAEFIKRPESNVYFICNAGDEVKSMLTESTQTGLRVNKQIPVKAYVNYPHAKEEIARFVLELSLKVI